MDRAISPAYSGHSILAGKPAYKAGCYTFGQPGCLVNARFDDKSRAAARTPMAINNEGNMKQVIDGKIYDTTKAHRVCDLPSPTNNPRDFKWHDTGLYRTTKGRFFLAGEGGPMSMWAERVEQNGWRSGSGLCALTDEEARDHMQAARCTAEEFIEVGLSVEEA